MIIYWSTWNFSWFCCSYFNILPFNYPLKTSLLVTSVIGGYTVYVYPRKMILRLQNKKIKVPYSILIASDILFHQLPFIYTLTRCNNNDNNKICGSAVFVPMGFWFGMHYFLKTNMDKLYGISIKNIIYSSTILYLGHGLCYHFIRKN